MNYMVVTLCVLLDKDKILLHRKTPDAGAPEAWGITIEEYFQYNEISPKFVATALSQALFGVDANKADLKSVAPINVGKSIVHPFILRLSKGLNFICKREDNYKIALWDDLHIDVAKEVVKAESNLRSKYTVYSLYSIAELNAKGLIPK